MVEKSNDSYGKSYAVAIIFLWLDNFLMMRKSIIKFMWMCYIFQRKKIKIFNELYGMRILKKIYSAISKRLLSLISVKIKYSAK